MRLAQAIKILCILAIGGNQSRVWGEITKACQEEGGYVSELFDIVQTQVQDEAEGRIDQQRTFYLCPETTYVLDSSKNNWFYIFLPNVHILCGKNGRRSNRCVVKTQVGQFQTLLLPGLYYGKGVTRRLDNILFRGVTFEFHGDIENGGSVLIQVPGHVVFEDCRWNDNWGEYLFIMNDHYALDDPEEDDSLKVEIKDCTIMNGRGGWGIFYNFGASLSVINTKVKNYDIVNYLPKDTNTSFSSVFDQFGGELVITNSCFTNVQVTDGIVVAQTRIIKDEDGNVVYKEYTKGIFKNNYAGGNTIRDASEEAACEDIKITTPNKSVTTKSASLLMPKHVPMMYSPLHFNPASPTTCASPVRTSATQRTTI